MEELNGENMNESRLSDTERRILEIALDPTFINKSLQAKCSAANVAKNTWYRAMKNPEFIKILNETAMDLLKGKINDVVNATYKYAIKNPKNSQDRKILLTMAGLYKDKSEVSSGEGGFDVNNHIDFSGITTEEIKKLLEEK